MNNAARVSILFALLLPLGLVVHASDAPFIIAQGGLPGQLPGQKPPGQLPGPSAVPAKPATAALPSTGLALPGLPCCSITAVNKTTGIVTAREKSGGRTIEIKATPAQVQNLRVGQDIFVNLQTRQASLDGKTICCSLIFAAATPSLAAPAHGAGTGAGMVAPAANVHHVSHALGLVSIGVHSPPSENAKGEADLSPPKAHKNVPLHGPGKQQQRLADTDDGRKLIQQGVKMLGGITMHASLLGGHKYMVSSVRLNIKQVQLVGDI